MTTKKRKYDELLTAVNQYRDSYYSMREKAFEIFPKYGQGFFDMSRMLTNMHSEYTEITKQLVECRRYGIETAHFKMAEDKFISTRNTIEQLLLIHVLSS